MQANIVIIKQHKAAEHDHLTILMTISGGSSGTKQDKKAPKASVVTVLDVIDPQRSLILTRNGLCATSKHFPTTSQSRVASIGYGSAWTNAN